MIFFRWVGNGLGWYVMIMNMVSLTNVQSSSIHAVHVIFLKWLKCQYQKLGTTVDNVTALQLH
jgi:hypothetical protein